MTGAVSAERRNRVLRIAVLDDYEGATEEIATWPSLSCEHRVQIFENRMEGDQLVEAVSTCEVVVAMRERTAFPAAVLAQLPRLKLLVTTGHRNAAIDLDAARSLGVVVSGTGGTSGGTVELTWGLIFALMRSIPALDASMRAGAWQPILGEKLNGKTMGIVGLGRIGSQVAKVAVAFGMRTIAWSPHLTPERATAVGAEAVSKAQLFASSDVVTVHLALGPGTVSVIGKTEVTAMKRSAFLINTARGGLVDQSALIEALEARRIRGAALDVFEEEPLAADHPLRRMGNVVLTPHVGYVTRETFRQFFDDVIEDINGYVAGSPVRRLA